MITFIELLDKLENEGGFTTNLEGLQPDTGYMVALDKHEVIFDNTLDRDTKLQLLKVFVRDNVEILLIEGMYFGAWLDKDTNRVYLDVSTNFRTLRKALEVAKENVQLAVWDVENKKEIKA